MSIYDRDFSKIDAKAVVAGSVVQAKNVLQAALDEIAALRAENARLLEALERARPYVQATYENCRYTNSAHIPASALRLIKDALYGEIRAEPHK